MSSNPRMLLVGTKRTFPLFAYLLYYDILSNNVFSCFCARYQPISHLIHHPTEPRIIPHYTARVTSHIAEPTFIIPSFCGNTFAYLLEESLYYSLLDLVLSFEALAKGPVPGARRHYIYTTGIAVCSGVNCSASSVISTSYGAEVKPDNLD